MEALPSNPCYHIDDTWATGYPAPEYVSGYEIPTEECGGISLPVLTSISMAEMGKQCMAQWYEYNQDELMQGGGMRRDDYLYQHQAYHLHKYGLPHGIHSTTIARRNERERNRVKTINSTFANLRQHLPTSGKNKKLSKVQILRSAIQYINQLQHILDAQEQDQLNPDQVKQEPEVVSSSSGDSLRAFDTDGVGSDCDMTRTESNRVSCVSPTSLVSESSSHLSSFGDDDNDDNDDEFMEEFSDWMK